ncbi:MAG: hypothetical protein WCJ44_05470 [Runella sp.]|jgi:hypothetical protein
MTLRSILLVGVLCWFLPESILAHRLDELLQSSYIMIAPDQISIEIILTPGATIASGVFQAIDNDHDGKLSVDEKRIYAKKVLNNTYLKIDGKEQKLVLFDVSCSPLQDLKEGVGKIRLLVSAEINDDLSKHQLYYMNTFEPMMSVYTINALMPNSKEIKILKQEREQNQFEIYIDYQQLVNHPFRYKVWLFSGVFIILSFLLFLTFKRSKNVGT